MKAFSLFLVTILAGAGLGIGGWHAYNDYYPKLQADAFNPPIGTDVLDRVVPVRDPENAGAVVGWYFAKGALMNVKKIDVRREDDRRYVVYADVWAEVDEGNLGLTGILEAHYHRVKDKFYLVGLGDVDLTMHKRVEKKKDNGSKIKTPPQPTDNPRFVPAQKLPGSK